MASQRSLYDVLNVAPDAESVVIEAAYRALMKKYHPDQADSHKQDASSSAAEINRAFAVLRDPTRRADYDHGEWKRRQAFHLAETKLAGEPRQRSAFGWSGWFVALLLGIVLYVLISERGALSGRAAGNGAVPVAASEPDHRSQPTKIEPAFLATVEPSETDREIAARETARETARRAAEMEARVAADIARREQSVQQELADIPEIRPEIQAEPAPAVRRRTPPPRPRAKAARPAETEEDFLKREGYIY